jgi:hypothetical protein
VRSVAALLRGTWLTWIEDMHAILQSGRLVEHEREASFRLAIAERG